MIFLFRAGAVAGFLLGESDTAFFEFETFGGDVFAVQVHPDFVGAHLEVEFRALSAEFGAFGEIGKTLESKELCVGVLSGSGECVRVFENGLVDFLREVGFFASVDGVEFVEGEALAGGDAAIDSLDASGFGPKALKRASGNLDSESFRAWFGDAVADFIGRAVLKPLCDLIDFLFGEAGE